MGGVATGDMVRMLDTREGWQHVQHADGRVGWLPESRLVALLGDAPSR
jgi:SH3-like domain-containing protein